MIVVVFLESSSSVQDLLNQTTWRPPEPDHMETSWTRPHGDLLDQTTWRPPEAYRPGLSAKESRGLQLQTFIVQ